MYLVDLNVFDLRKVHGSPSLPSIHTNHALALGSGLPWVLRWRSFTNQKSQTSPGVQTCNQATRDLQMLQMRLQMQLQMHIASLQLHISEPAVLGKQNVWNLVGVHIMFSLQKSSKLTDLKDAQGICLSPKSLGASCSRCLGLWIEPANSGWLLAAWLRLGYIPLKSRSLHVLHALSKPNYTHTKNVWFALSASGQDRSVLDRSI